MITFYLYPKKLKEVVVELNRDGSLNKAAQLRFNCEIHKCLIRSIFLAVLLGGAILLHSLDWVVAAVFFGILIGVAELSYSLKLMFRMAFLYTYGHRVPAENLTREKRVTYGNYQYAWRFDYSFCVEGCLIKGSLFSLNKKFHYRSFPLEEAEIAYESSNAQNNIPVFFNLEEIFNLRESH